MLAEIERFCRHHGLAGCSYHFADPQWAEDIAARGFCPWAHQSFVWGNEGFLCFDDYLSRFNANQRRNIRRERRRLAERGIRVDMVAGEELPGDFYERMHAFYKRTNDQFGPWGCKYLTGDFFALLPNHFRKRLVFAVASDGGRRPVLVDTSPCLYRMKKVMDRRLRLLDPVEFTLTHLLERLEITPLNEAIAYHHTCSSVKLGLEARAMALARACARDVVVPDLVGCCGFAGDRGFNYPELNASALKHLKAGVAGQCRVGYSTSRTCEIGLSAHSGIHYKSILYLVDRCTRPKRDNSVKF